MNNSQYLASSYQAQRDQWREASGASKATKEDVADVNEPVNMLYVQHNLKNNYFSASGSGDARMKRDILISEIAKLIATRGSEVVELLRKHGFRISDKPSENTLVEKTAAAISGSREFTKDLISLIARTGGKFSAEGGNSQTNYAGIINNASDLVGSLGSLFGGKKRAKAQAAKDAAEAKRLKAQAELEKLKAQNALKGAVGGMTGKNISSKTALYIAGGILVGSAIGYGIYVYVTTKKKA